MAGRRNRKNKVNPHYEFLVSWKPTQAHVKGESENARAGEISEARGPKNANVPAIDGTSRQIKKDIGRSLIYVAIILTLELVVYLAWSRFI